MSCWRQVCIDNLDVIEVCDWSDESELIASGSHVGMETARERYARHQMPRSISIGDQIDGFQGVIGFSSLFAREHLRFTLSTLRLKITGKK